MYKFKPLCLFSLLCISPLSFAGDWTMMGKSFDTTREALAHQVTSYMAQVDKIEPAEYFGGSIFIHMPSDVNLRQAPFVTGHPNDEQREYFLNFYKQDFEGIKIAIERSRMFDSVELKQLSSYLRYTRKHGYRYLLVNNGDGTWTLFDMYQDKDKTFRFPKGLDNLVYSIEDVILKFEKSKSTRQLSSGYQPQNEKLIYDDRTQRGTLSIRGKGIQARSWMLRKIGEIAASRNVLLKSGEQPKAGHFLILNEKIENNVFSIDFETVY